MEPALLEIASRKFKKVRKAMGTIYNQMYHTKVRPMQAPRADQPGLQPAHDADKENAGVQSCAFMQ